MSQIVEMNHSGHFWSKNPPILNDEGEVIAGGMWPHQLQWWDSPAFIRALVMGYGGGKTYIQAKRAIIMAWFNGPSPYMVVSPSYKLAKRTIIPAIKDLLKGRDIPYTYNKTDHEFILWGCCIIWIGSGEHPDSLKGPNLCGAGIDEPFIQDRAVFDQMIARVRDPIAKHREITLTGTPEDLNWGYDICEGHERDNFDLELIRESSRANLALPSEYITTMENAYDNVVAEAYIDGKFVNMTQGQIYYGFERERNVKKLVMPQEATIGLGLDFNVNPMAGALFWHTATHIHYFEEFELPNSDTPDAIERAHELASKHGQTLKLCYPDASGKSRSTKAPGGTTDFTHIKDGGLKVKARPSNPTIRNRRNAANAKWKKGTATVDPRCKQFIRYREQLCHEKLKKQESMTHLTDAGDYPLAYLFPIKKPIIQGGYK